MATTPGQTFGIDLQGLIRLLAKNLYAQPDVFVREMLQNAHDAIERRRHREGRPVFDGNIRVRLSKDAIAFDDNGEGLTESEIREYLSTIGRSGTDAFRQQVLSRGRHAGTSVIGQFGIGLLSAFVVSDRVEVHTRSVKRGSPAWRWSSTGDGRYLLERGDREDPGTTVTLSVRPDSYLDMLDRERVTAAIRKYADFLPCPIHMGDDPAPVNAVTPPWRRTYATRQQLVQEYRGFVDRRYPDNALHVIPVHLSEPRVEGILYVSDFHVPDFNTTGLVDVYQSGMFVVSNHRELLPRWAKFVRGIVDAPDLTPTAARDNVQQDAAFAKVRDALGRVVLEDLKALAASDRDLLTQILRWHSYHAQMMAVTDDEFFEAAADLIPLETNQGPMTVPDYLAKAKAPRSREDQPVIVYFTDRGSALQYDMLFTEKGMFVVDACYAFTEELLEKFGKTRGVKLVPVAVASSEILFPEPPEAERVSTDPLLRLLSRRLDRRVAVRLARFDPAHLPAVLIPGQDARLKRQVDAALQNPGMPEFIRKLLADVSHVTETAGIDATLFLNTSNETVRRLARARSERPDDETIMVAADAIFSSAALLAQEVPSPAAIKAIFSRATAAVDRMVSVSDDLAQVRSELARLRESAPGTGGVHDASSWVTCFAALPEGAGCLRDALRAVVESPAIGWQLVAREAPYVPPDAPAALLRSVLRADCCLVDLTPPDPMVSFEAGLAFGRSGLPIGVLARKSNGSLGSAPQGQVRLAIPHPEHVAPGELATAIRAELKRVPAFAHLLPGQQPGRKRYLAPAVVFDAGVSDAYASALMKTAWAAEDLVAAAPSEVAARTGVRERAVEMVQEHVAHVYGIGRS